MDDLSGWACPDDDAAPPPRRKRAVDEAALEAELFGAGAAAAPADDAAPAPSGAAAWVDDDDDLAVDLRSAARLRKLRKKTGDRVLRGGDLEERLRERFAASRGPQAWATSGEAPSALAAAAAEDDNEDDDGTALLRVERKIDANARAPGKASILATGFHPAEDVLFAAGLDKTLRFFRVDGEANEAAGAAHLADLPVHAACWSATPGERVVYAAGRRPFYYRYDVAAGVASKVRARPRSGDASLERFAAAPDGGLLAFTAREGRVLLADARRSCWLPSELKLSGTARAVAFSPAGDRIYAAGGDATVYCWDARSSRCLETFPDAGASPTSSLLCVDKGEGHWLLVGSESGVVNVYARGAGAAAPSGFAPAAAPRPARVVSSLTTTITTLAASDDLIALASKWGRDALRVLRTPSLRVAPNWPTAKTPLHYVTATAFNAGGDLLAMGNDRGRVLLYSLKNP